MEFLTKRKDAIKAGHTHYFTGKPCKRGHTAIRNVAGHCTVCNREDKVNAYHKDPMKHRLQSRESYARCRSERLMAATKYYKENKEAIIIRNKKHKKAIKQATPVWLNELDKFLIDELYAMSLVRSNDTGVKHHVDHIVPLRGKNVCGLHVAWNLQLLTAKENLQKNNTFVEDLF